MTFDEAKIIAAQYGAKLPRWPYAGPGTAGDCWIDRVAALPMVAGHGLDIGPMIAECNRYA